MATIRKLQYKNGDIVPIPIPNPLGFPNVVPSYDFSSHRVGSISLDPQFQAQAKDVVEESLIAPIQEIVTENAVDIITGFLGIGAIILALAQIVKPI